MDIRFDGSEWWASCCAFVMGVTCVFSLITSLRNAIISYNLNLGISKKGLFYPNKN